jgi:ParB family chromosome partitioning protein
MAALMQAYMGASLSPWRQDFTALIGQAGEQICGHLRGRLPRLQPRDLCPRARRLRRDLCGVQAASGRRVAAGRESARRDGGGIGQGRDMAKRKRLSPALMATETGSEGRIEPVSRPRSRQVAGESAASAAFAEVARELTEAREEGRLIQRLPLEAIETGHLVRDRIAFDGDEMAALRSSLGQRGQQVPIEVVNTGDGRYGLISGLRRVMALREIGAADVLALVRRPESSAEAYLAMVEENEIRAGISFYERARLAAEAARLGLYPDPRRRSALFGVCEPGQAVEDRLLRAGPRGPGRCSALPCCDPGTGGAGAGRGAGPRRGLRRRAARRPCRRGRRYGGGRARSVADRLGPVVRARPATRWPRQAQARAARSGPCRRGDRHRRAPGMGPADRRRHHRGPVPGPRALAGRQADGPRRGQLRKADTWTQCFRMRKHCPPMALREGF